jgi:hypothetical protein
MGFELIKNKKNRSKNKLRVFLHDVKSGKGGCITFAYGDNDSIDIENIKKIIINAILKNERESEV